MTSFSFFRDKRRNKDRCLPSWVRVLLCFKFVQLNQIHEQYCCQSSDRRIKVSSAACTLDGHKQLCKWQVIVKRGVTWKCGVIMYSYVSKNCRGIMKFLTWHSVHRSWTKWFSILACYRLISKRFADFCLTLLWIYDEYAYKSINMYVQH